MKKIYGISLGLLCAATGLLGCQSTNSEAAADSQEILLAGTYNGVLPCASCSGIKTSVVLSKENTFVRTQHFMDSTEHTKPYVDKGSFTVSGNDHVTLNIANENPQYQITRDSLIMLGANGEQPSGALADQYVLKKAVK
ncbi:MAG: copper resistance protein NlpE N-terminal domain-containing protein [Gammaproteobacteria bacterium]|nr:copper resistance protein NlpE N-terminal domain-containing protein [Gammaproteobacteria bacterium]